MARGNPDSAPRHLDTLFRIGAAGGWTDAQLLERFTSRRDEAAELAFGALLERHGPMVLRVCRAVLRDPDEAQDAFQATFLILVRRAESLWVRDSLAPWLHQVAYRTASHARSATARRRRHEGRAAELGPRSAPEGHRDDIEAIILEEVDRLPGRYREAVRLCLLEGLTPDQAARHLDCPAGTVHSRLARGRDRMRARLTRRGIAPTVPLAVGLSASSECATSLVPPSLAASTIRAATQLLRGTMATGMVHELFQGVIRTMVWNPMRMVLVALLAGVVVVTTGTWAVRAGATAQQPKPGGVEAKAKEVREIKPEAADQPEARRLALAAHASAGSFDRLPRFSYQVRYRHGVVDSMRAVDASLDRLKQAMTAPVVEKDWLGWYDVGFSWDEERFLWELKPGSTPLNYDARYWTKTDAWERHEANDRSSVNFVRASGPATFWKDFGFFDFSYLRLTPHRYWWGQTAKVNGQTMSLVPPEECSWRSLGHENFGDEMCEIVDSPERTLRLWIGQGSRQVRAALTYQVDAEREASQAFYNSEPIQKITGKTFATQQDYGRWRQDQATEDQLIRVAVAYSGRRTGTDPAKISPNEFVRFDNYREIAPGVWLPFLEVRVFPHASETVKGKRQLIRSELRVESVRTDQDLTAPIARLGPKPGDPVQDQRYVVPVDLEYRADRADADIRHLAEAEYTKRLAGEATLKTLTSPIAALIGTPAPELPKTGWIGDRPVTLAGKPYLLHFWATWCGPCKNDLPRLKTLAAQGVTILGMHPPGTPRAEVEKEIRDQQLGYPTFLAADQDEHASIERIGGYPAGVFPYCILVDAQGRVAAHGALSEVASKLRAAGR